MEREIRTVTAAEKLEVRQVEGEATVIQGYAALFNEETNIFNLFTESIAPGAFADSLARGDEVKALFNHDMNQLLGSRTAGTLALREDMRGLWMETQLPNTQLARDLTEHVRIGNIRGQSFAFTIEKQEWEFADKPGGLDARRITKAKLYDVGPVVSPAYEKTSVGLRSQAERALEEARREHQQQKVDEVAPEEPPPPSPPEPVFDRKAFPMPPPETFNRIVYARRRM